MKARARRRFYAAMYPRGAHPFYLRVCCTRRTLATMRKVVADCERTGGERHDIWRVDVLPRAKGLGAGNAES